MTAKGRSTPTPVVRSRFLRLSFSRFGSRCHPDRGAPSAPTSDLSSISPAQLARRCSCRCSCRCRRRYVVILSAAKNPTLDPHAPHKSTLQVFASLFFALRFTLSSRQRRVPRADEGSLFDF